MAEAELSSVGADPGASGSSCQSSSLGTCASTAPTVAEFGVEHYKHDEGSRHSTSASSRGGSVDAKPAPVPEPERGRRRAAAEADSCLLRDRVVSWLGCTDSEVDKLQRSLNNGTASSPMVPGIMVIDNYFACRPGLEAEPPQRSRAHAENGFFTSLWDGAVNYLSRGIVDMAGLCLSRAGNGRQPTAAANLGAANLFSDSAVLEVMSQELQTAACSGCKQRIVGKRLRCVFCEDFNLCEACTSMPLHWPRAPLPAHLDAFQGHRFQQVSLPVLRCPEGHHVIPGALYGAQGRCCNECFGPLSNGVLPPGEGPQFRCCGPQCEYAVCSSCYWLSRQALQEEESQQEFFDCHEGKERHLGRGNDPCDEYRKEPLKCHMLFSSPLCVGHTVRVQTLLSEPSLLDPWREVESWGVRFHRGHHSVLSDVYQDGRVAAWNLKQEAMADLVKPGDTLVQIAVGDIILKVNGARATDVLKQIFQELRRKCGGDVPGLVGVDLFFSGMRSLPQLRIEGELEMLKDTGCEILPQAATTENVRRLIAADDCRILHFSFHTSSDQSRRVFLEDNHGRAHVLTSNDFQRLLTTQGQHHIFLVFISSCHSFTLGQLIAATGIRHVVCVRDEHWVLDSSCQIFERHFFIAIGAGKPVQHAFECGMAALATNPCKRICNDSDKFILLPEGADHSEVLLPSVVAVSPSRALPDGAAWGALPAQVEDFGGREAELVQLLYTLKGDNERRFILLQGDPGIGKSVLMAEAGRFVRLRRNLFHEVRWLDREHEKGIQELRLRLAMAPHWHVLLLVDDQGLLYWRPLQELLVLPNVYLVVATAPTTTVSARLNRGALEAGVKPVRFPLGPPEPLAQARLFAKRAARSLFVAEVKHGFGGTGPVWIPKRPADYLTLASSPLVTQHKGNPRSLVAAAQMLQQPDIFSMQAGAIPASASEVAEGPSQHFHRKVKLVLPDGRTKCEWLPEAMRIGEVLAKQSPRALREDADVFIEGAHAQPDMSLAHFADDRQHGLLVLELRGRPAGSSDRE